MPIPIGIYAFGSSPALPDKARRDANIAEEPGYKPLGTNASAYELLDWGNSRARHAPPLRNAPFAVGKECGAFSNGPYNLRASRITD